MSTTTLSHFESTEFEGMDRFEKIVRSDSGPMPVHRSAAARRAHSRSATRSNGKRWSSPGGVTRRRTRKIR